ncbi:MAG: type III PLP-dependent enzyme [Alphaproteobacteria bacterium]|nr:type III PLP-dependent enzyme [Alphaproteobacteria bacterium]
MTNDFLCENRSRSILQFTLHEDQLADHETLRVDHDIDDAFIRTLNPAIPVPILHPEKLFDKTREFISAFTGEVLYAVKCNPDKLLLKTMYAGGVRKFDAASIAEVRLIRGLFPDAKIYFMHPIKAPEAIREAYVNHNVRAFVLDYAGELEKILEETNAAPDLELFVRMAIPKDNSGKDVATDFSSKFGAKPAQAIELLRACRPYCKKLGLSFHVGTQCSDPEIYSRALAHAATVIRESGVEIEVLDIGGGFPAELNTDVTAIPPLDAFTKNIAAAITAHNLGHLQLLCEVGRGLVACAGSLIVRVEGRKDDLLYLNDGTYGGLFEAGGSIGLPYPAKLITREQTDESATLKAFRFAGPTCDSVDMMHGPFMLPENVQVGDWIMLDQLGAYGEVSRTDFNGFGSVHKIIVQKEVARSQSKAKSIEI